MLIYIPHWVMHYDFLNCMKRKLEKWSIYRNSPSYFFLLYFLSCEKSVAFICVLKTSKKTSIYFVYIFVWFWFIILVLVLLCHMQSIQFCIKLYLCVLNWKRKSSSTYAIIVSVWLHQPQLLGMPKKTRFEKFSKFYSVWIR